MHRVIRILVVAGSAKDAKFKAAGILDNFANEGVVDFGLFFDDKRASSGWGRLPVGARLASKAGAQLLLSGLQVDYESFVKHLATIRQNLADTEVDALANEADFRFHLSLASKVSFVYADGWGANGLTKDDVVGWLSESAKEPLAHFWVVPCDVHT